MQLEPHVPVYKKNTCNYKLPLKLVLNEINEVMIQTRRKSTKRSEHVGLRKGANFTIVSLDYTQPRSQGSLLPTLPLSLRRAGRREPWERGCTTLLIGLNIKFYEIFAKHHVY